MGREDNGWKNGVGEKEVNWTSETGILDKLAGPPIPLTIGPPGCVVVPGNTAFVSTKQTASTSAV